MKVLALQFRRQHGHIHKLGPVKQDLVIDVIRDHVEPGLQHHLAQGRQFVFGVDAAGGIGGAVNHQGLGPGGEPGL